MVTLKMWLGAAIALGALSAGAATPQPADQPVDTAQAMLDRMDRNMDGMISFEEYRNAMIRRFGARDVNNDGVLEGDEFPKEWLAGADVQQATGQVTFEQFAVELQVVYDRFDVNKDGQLESAEIAAFAAARKNQEESRS
jgi:Ca2+-binding EF-hand superfamily protein